MKKTFFQLFFYTILVLTTGLNVFSQDYNYDYNNWPGKINSTKANIEIDKYLISNYGMSLAAGYSDSSLFYKIPLNADDFLKEGRLQLKIYSSPSEAQNALAEYLECLTTTNKPKRLQNEIISKADVAFGMEFNGNLNVAYTKNNLFINIYAPYNNVLEIMKEISLKVENSDDWERGEIKPFLIFNK